MKQIPVRQLKPGMVTASDVITKRGQLIAQKGTALTSQLIARLSFYRIESVDIDRKARPAAGGARRQSRTDGERPAGRAGRSGQGSWRATGQHVSEDAGARFPC